jgi:aminoglycoside phosphotransferase (APT) family kinase protein
VSDRAVGIGDALRIATHSLDTEIIVIRRVPSFAGNRVYRVRTDTDTIYVKFAAAADIDREHSVLRALHAHDVPVPEVLAATADGLPHIVTREVSGQPLPAEQAENLRNTLDVVHSLRVRGFGSVQGDADGTLVAPHDSWLDVIIERAESARDVVAAGFLDERLYEHALAVIDAHQSELGAVTDAQLLHGDMTPRHAYVDDQGRITAIIDWGDATGGDPRYDTARLIQAAIGTHGVDRAIELAALAAPHAQRAPRSLLLIYGAVFALWSMYGELTSGDPYKPWFPVQAESLGRVLAAIEED